MGDYGNRIKAAREAAELTQEQLGNKIGLTGVSIMRYEKNQREPNQKILKLLANALNVSVDYLIGTSEEKWSVSAAMPKNHFFNWLAKLGFLTAKHTQEGIDEYFIIDSETSSIFPVSLKQLKELERESATFTKFQITEFLKAITPSTTAPKSTPAPPEGKGILPPPIRPQRDLRRTAERAKKEPPRRAA